MVRTFSLHWLSKFKLLLLLSVFMNLSIFAQSGAYPLSGTVTDSAGPTPGVSVIIKGTDTGTVTDFDGKYNIEVKSGDILEFVYLGFKTENVIITGQQVVDVSLVEDTESLDEIVVVGYGTQKRKNLTGSIAKVSGKKLTKSSVARVDDALVGRVSGVQIAASNPEAGGDTTINIRGVGTITGDSSPLIVVDGIALGNDADLLGSINTNDIKSVEVLKDASAVAIYGSRGANGVIIVSLKDGVAGDTRFSYNTFLGTKWVPHNDTYTGSLSSWGEYINSFEGRANEVGGEFLEKWYAGKSRLAAANLIAAAGGGETDWQGVMLPGGTIESHDFAVSGGAGNSSFRASIGYLHDGGVLVNDDFKRYNASVKVKGATKNKKVEFRLNLTGSHADQDRATENMTTMMRFSPWNPIFLKEESLALINRSGFADAIIFADSEVGDYSVETMYDNVFTQDGVGGLLRDASGNILVDNYGAGDLSMNTTSNTNAYAKVTERTSKKEQSDFRGNASVKFKLAKGLSFKQSIMGDIRLKTATQYRGLLHNKSYAGRTERDVQIDTRIHFGNESLLRYKRDIKKHGINAVAGFSYDVFNYTQSDTDSGLYTDDFTQAINTVNEITTVEYFQDKLVSYFGRLNYDFDDRYLLTVTGRTDGSSRFGENTKFGFFPAASIGWRVSNESFLENSGVITELKLRASYGKSGTNTLSRTLEDNFYRDLTTFAPSTYNGQTGVEVNVLSNPDLGWEGLTEFNPGLDLTIANGLLDVSFDYYERTSDDLILELPVPTGLGVDTQIQNIGEVVNTGYELELGSRIFNRENFTWNISGIISTNENEVTNFGGVEQLISRIDESKRATEFLTEVGGPISTFYGYVYDSEVPIEDVLSPFSVSHSHPAFVNVKDINGDGEIDEDDRTVLGDPFPDFTWSVTNNFTYKNFDFSFMFQGSEGAQVRVSDIEYLKNEFSTSRLYLEPGVASAETSRLRIFTSDHIKDASFIALRNVNLGYSLPSSVIDKLNLSRLRLYVTAENLLYITDEDYFGFNPEGVSRTSSNANTGITYGYQRGELPIAKTVTVGLNLEF